MITATGVMYANEGVITKFLNTIIDQNEFVEVTIVKTPDPDTRDLIFRITNCEEYKHPLIFNKVPTEEVKKLMYGPHAIRKVFNGLRAAIDEQVEKNQSDKYILEAMLDLIDEIEGHIFHYWGLNIKTIYGNAICGEMMQSTPVQNEEPKTNFYTVPLK